MTPTYHLNEAKMSMKARKWKQGKKKYDQIVSFKKLLLYVLFLLVPV